MNVESPKVWADGSAPITSLKDLLMDVLKADWQSRYLGAHLGVLEGRLRAGGNALACGFMLSRDVAHDIEADSDRFGSASCRHTEL